MYAETSTHHWSRAKSRALSQWQLLIHHLSENIERIEVEYFHSCGILRLYLLL